ncbi:Actin-related protein 4 [Vitis vinifera]|uniref:Actin-related protein 4 n=1 Tax=Vitis vinifera TaxID=29760 RepID=A0A438JYH1_VITVI|nr:Actin-related protein 4 [Vitis vinifera]
MGPPGLDVALPLLGSQTPSPLWGTPRGSPRVPAFTSLPRLFWASLMVALGLWTIEIGADRFKVPDVLFNPSLAQTIPNMESFADIAPSVRGLPQMVIESINKCDVDIRRELFSSILLAGGTASMQQLKERLEKDLLEESPQTARVKVLASGNSTERRFSVWIGGSILASLGSFQQMWFSKAEYEEHGASYIQRKCP